MIAGGDDLNDYAAMSLCGWKAYPSDAVAKIKAIADYISPHCGGHGAVRDVCEELLFWGKDLTSKISRRNLAVANVTGGLGTEAYMIGCAHCRKDSADADIQSSTTPHPLDPTNTLVHKRDYI
jgi:hypothetical protein